MKSNITNRQKSQSTATALEEYINKVYILVLLVVPGACLCAGLIYTLEKILGWLPSVHYPTLIVFDLTCLIYLAIGIYFVLTGFSNGLVSPGKIKNGKIFLVIIMFIQFNFILYMIPATDFWGFAFFFVVLTSFFLDYKMVSITALEIAASIGASWFIWGEIHLPAKNEFFITNMIDRVVCVVLSLLSIVLLTYLINRFLVNAKKDEMERNNEHVQTVLSSVQSLSRNLYSAGETLSSISQNESTSASILSSTSEELLARSNLLSTKTEESLSNLNELNKWETVVADNVKKAEITSQNLLDKSQDNTQLLNDLHAINNEVSESMLATIDAAQKLSEAVNEIGATLNLIRDISTSTNLLALNASIEAARAGESGKGFAVVAQEVGNLANSTKDSLNEVENVISRVQTNVNEITAHIEENSQKLDRQNSYYNHVFEGMQDMINLLNISVDAVNTVSDAHDQQACVIKNTASINQDIAESIKSENQQFISINGMVETNAADIAEMTNQANIINQMVDEINHLLKDTESV